MVTVAPSNVTNVQPLATDEIARSTAKIIEGKGFHPAVTPTFTHRSGN